ncbi:MAG: Gfo/Idh/MocA family oxidoreductase [Planctomycetota bacterium]|nr:Gfo/Idh/MocA family oxidoreductase [Planctomycetota bacterium]
MSKIKLALIGCGGNMRGAHLPRIKANKHIELVAIADTAQESLTAFVEKWGAPLPTYTDYKKMLKDHDLDAVTISTPHSMHYEQAKRALEKGCHTLVEKPLTIRAADTRALLKLAKKKRKILHVSYQRHHYPVYRCVRDLVKKGAIGEPRAIVAYVTQAWGWGTGGWRLVPKLSGGGMFMDTGSHLVAASLYTTGWKVSEATAIIDNKDKKVDILAAVAIRFQEGAVGTICTVGQASKRHDERLAIHGTEGCIVIHLHQWGIKSVLLNDEPLKIPASYKNDTPDEAFIRWIRGGKGYEPPAYALEVQHLSEAAYKSAKTGKRVKVAR